MTREATEKIVIVDDDRTQLTALQLTLEGQGYEVVAVERGEDVLTTLEREMPDLLMLDILMPNVNGLELLSQIKSDDRWQDLPILMISILSPEDASVESLGLGAADFVAKPFRAKELGARVDAQLRAGHALRQARVEARRAAVQAAVRSEMLDILHEVTSVLGPDEIYQVLASRVMHALEISRCSIILCSSDSSLGHVVVAADRPGADAFEIDLNGYPEIQRALETNESVLIRDVQSDPLLQGVRDEWLARGQKIDTRSMLVIPFKMQGRPGGVFYLRTFPGDGPLDEQDQQLASSVIGTAVGVMEKAYDLEDVQSAKERFEFLAAVDPLTGCLNRRSMTDRLEVECARAQRYGLALSILMIDLDHFKEINDTRGHLVGDDVLRKIGMLLRAQVRNVDAVARYGGEEFVAILPETTFEGAKVLADRIRERIAEFPFQDRGKEFQVTASLGLTTVDANVAQTPGDVLTRADAALYRAKTSGRNQVCS
jgi:two-component system cell cycle response regulator